ncbi:MAG: pyridoxal phosphate-dependent aminotransferase [Lachnospiraceae bacterium]|nr:pyridoxal phosphate-dependent aminotransferase [Lachnospiraceae bacterium]
MSYTLNNKILDIPEALSIYMNQLVYSEKRKGLDVVTLSLGEAFFDIPQFLISETDFVKGYHYSDSLGIPELREKILDYYNKNYGCEIEDINQVMISSGSKAIIYMVMLTVCSMGDEVLIHEPAWLSYQEQARLVNAVPVFAPYNISAKEIVDLFTEKTKLLVLNNPNNPAGWIYSQDDLRYIYEECKKRDIYILVDEAYSDFVVEDKEFISMSVIAEELDGVFIVNSLSKNMGMSGWRIGYVISSKKNIAALLILNQHIITCAPTILQRYIAQYFDDIVSITMPQVKEVVKKRNRILSHLDDVGLKYLPGNSTFYIFVNIGDLDVDTLDFCLYLLFKHGIATVPGGAYGKSTDKFIRIGIGAESEERIVEAISVIEMVVKNKLANKNYVQHKLEINNYHRFGE